MASIFGFASFEIYLGFAVRQAQALSEAEGVPGIWDFRLQAG